MKKLFRYIRKILKNSFDNIRNEHLKQNLLQAIPFWIGSVITGLIAVLYAQLFAFGEHILNKILSWHLWMIFIVAPLGFVLSWWLVKKYAPFARGSGIPQVMAAVELANPRDNHQVCMRLPS